MRQHMPQRRPPISIHIPREGDDCKSSKKEPLLL